MPTDFFNGIRHVCFDKDGTLTDVHAYWAHIGSLRAQRIGENLKLNDDSVAGLRDAMGILNDKRLKPEGPTGYHPRPSVIAAAERFLRSIGRLLSTDELATLFAEVDAKLQETGDYRLMLLAGVPELLDSLVQRGITLTLYTSDRSVNARKALDKVGISHFFSHIVGGDHVQRPKPNPEGFHAACSKAGVPPAFSAYVGDTLSDLHMAKTGGCARAIGVATGLDTLSALSRETDYACATLRELLAQEVAR